MYIIQNACKSITRNKLRNILMGIIVLVIAVSACVALSIRQAAEAARQDTLQDMTITAQISFDRTKAMEEMAPPTGEPSGQNGGRPDRGRFDFDILQGSSLSLEDYMTYTQAQREGDGYYYSGAFSLDATGDLLAYGTEEESEDETAATASPDGTSGQTDERGQAPGMNGMEAQTGGIGGMNGQGGDMGGGAGPGMGGRRFQVNEGDFSITGYSSYDAMLSLFGEDGSYTVTEGEMFDETSADLTCIISNELAMYNGISAGDTITLCNPKAEEETYTLTVSGIYTNSASSSQENNRFAMNDPANNIYMNYSALQAIADASEEADNKTTDSAGEEVSAALDITLAFTYTFSSADHYNAFTEQVRDLGLSDDYTVSSMDLAAFENSLTPLETLSTAAMWFFLIVLLVGGIILVTVNIFNLRERKYEVGVLTAIGMKKGKVAAQFITELFLVTFVAIFLGAGIGAAVSVPVTNALLANQISSREASGNTVSENFGFDRGDMQGGPADQGQNGPGMKGGRFDREASPAASYVDSVTSATNLTVIAQLMGVGILLTVLSSLAALISILRYEPLKILSSRS